MCLIKKKLLSQIHPSMNSALNTIKTTQLKYQLSIRRRLMEESAMPLAAMQDGVAADCINKLINH
jgi:hypothetical protein